MKLLRKVKGQWVAVALASGLIATVAPHEVTAQENNHLEDFTQNHSFTNTLTAYINETIHRFEQNPDQIRTVDDIKKEIDKQNKIGLPVYVVQHGDSLVAIAQASHQDVQVLCDLNNLADQHTSLEAGDTLEGVLDGIQEGTTRQKQAESVISFTEINQSNIESRRKEVSQTNVQHSDETIKDLKRVTNEVVDQVSKEKSRSELEEAFITDILDKIAKSSLEPTVESEPIDKEDDLSSGVTGDLAGDNNKPAEDPKPEQPQPEEPKSEEPKPEKPQPEESKPEEPKEEAPTPEVPGEDEPRSEQPKPEDPKAEEPQPEKPIYEVKTRSEEKEIPFDTETVENSNFDKGTQRVIQEGRPGKVVITYEDIYKDGKLVESREIRRDELPPKTEIIEIGTKEDVKPVYEVKTITKTEIIPYEKVTRESNELDKGKEQIVQEGQVGTLEITIEEVYKDGKLVSSKPVAQNVIKEAIPEIKEIGIKEPESNREVKIVKETKPIPAEDKITTDPNVPKGYYKVLEIPMAGVETTTYEEVYENGKLISRNKIDQKVTNKPRTGHTIKGGKETGIVGNYDPAQGLSVGETLIKETDLQGNPTKTAKITEIQIENPMTIEEASRLTDDEKYQLTAEFRTPQNKVITDDGYFRTVPLTNDTIKQINALINPTKLNFEFLKLLNEERQSQGLHRLAYSPALYHQ
ncbi:G5 domain-containing protein [Hutsoniella sourekii]